MVPFTSTLHLQLSWYTDSFLASRTRIKTLAYDNIIANARSFVNDITVVPCIALTVGVATALDPEKPLSLLVKPRQSLGF